MNDDHVKNLKLIVKKLRQLTQMVDADVPTIKFGIHRRVSELRQEIRRWQKQQEK